MIITSQRAIELFNSNQDNLRFHRKDKPIETEEELGDTLGHGRTNGVVNIEELNENERQKLVTSDFFDIPKSGRFTYLCMESYPHIFWIGVRAG